MGVVVRGMEGRATFWSEILQAEKLVEPGSRRRSTTFSRDLLKALVSLMCSVDLGVYYSCSVRIVRTPVAVRSLQEVEEGRSLKDVEYEFRR
jgi:hypothetical protein